MKHLPDIVKVLYMSWDRVIEYCPWTQRHLKDKK